MGSIACRGREADVDLQCCRGPTLAGAVRAAGCARRALMEGAISTTLQIGSTPTVTGCGTIRIWSEKNSKVDREASGMSVNPDGRTEWVAFPGL
jgi:hypothetical protein